MLKQHLIISPGMREYRILRDSRAVKEVLQAPVACVEEAHPFVRVDRLVTPLLTGTRMILFAASRWVVERYRQRLFFHRHVKTAVISMLAHE